MNADPQRTADLIEKLGPGRLYIDQDDQGRPRLVAHLDTGDARADLASAEYDLAQLIVAIERGDDHEELLELAERARKNGRDGWLERAVHGDGGFARARPLAVSLEDFEELVGALRTAMQTWAAQSRRAWLLSESMRVGDGPPVAPAHLEEAEALRGAAWACVRPAIRKLLGTVGVGVGR